MHQAAQGRQPTGITGTLIAEGLVMATNESPVGTTYSSNFSYNTDDLPVTTILPGGVRTNVYVGPG